MPGPNKKTEVYYNIVCVSLKSTGLDMFEIHDYIVSEVSAPFLPEKVVQKQTSCL